jgi:hypothetical protein
MTNCVFFFLISQKEINLESEKKKIMNMKIAINFEAMKLG